MNRKLAVVMDPIATIHFNKDTTLAMLNEAQSRGFILHYVEQGDLFIENAKPYANAKPLEVFMNHKRWFALGPEQVMPLSQFAVILMRKDPPFDLEYIYTTYLLELAEASGVCVINKPQALRDANEKLFTQWFPDLIPATLVAKNTTRLADFIKRERDVVLKPLNSMGGNGIVRVSSRDPALMEQLDQLTLQNTQMWMAQRFVREIDKGDKRIIIINGKCIPFALARIPGVGSWLGNLAQGAKGVAQPLSPRDQAIGQRIAPELVKRGLVFVGIDVIGDYLTEVNVTSPTGVRELDQQCGLNISSVLFDAIEEMLQGRNSSPS